MYVEGVERVCMWRVWRVPFTTAGRHPTAQPRPHQAPCTALTPRRQAGLQTCPAGGGRGHARVRVQRAGRGAAAGWLVDCGTYAFPPCPPPSGPDPRDRPLNANFSSEYYPDLVGVCGGAGHSLSFASGRASRWLWTRTVSFLLVLNRSQLFLILLCPHQGFWVAVDGAMRLQRNLPSAALVSFAPPGSFYQDSPITDDVQVNGDVMCVCGGGGVAS